MKRIAFALLLAALLLVAVCSGLAQGQGPVLDILGDANTADPANTYVHVSVVDRDSGRIIDGLSEGNFAVSVDERPVGFSVAPATTGVAVVMVIDRGGIARSGDRRIGQAVDLADSLLGMLAVDGSPHADMVALLGIRGDDQGGITPAVPFTDYDPQAIRNEFDGLRNTVVAEPTPLYDGIDRAIEWITDNPNRDTQAMLNQRRPIIVVFSDGIDSRFSDEAHETLIINKCRQHNILLYTVRMGGGSTDADNMETLARQCSGVYVTHDSQHHDEVIELFQNIVTQRQSYRLTFPFYQPEGTHRLTVQVLDTPLGDAQETINAVSRLQLPTLSLVSPGDGLTVTVPYSLTYGGPLPTSVLLNVQIDYPDGIARAPAEVRYYANGTLIGRSNAGPTYDFYWEVSTLVEPTDEEQSRQYTFRAEANDPYLQRVYQTADPVDLTVVWEKLPFIPASRNWLQTYWWVLAWVLVLAAGLLVMLALLLTVRRDVGRKIVASTTGVLKGMTRPLSAIPQRAPGKLIIIQGANVGKEFRLADQVVKVGRDPQFCDFALYDEYVSNPHFSIQLEQGQFYITDLGSKNQTKVNNILIPQQQRVLLQPDAIIEVGTTRLQFKRVGGTTRDLSAGVAPAPSVSYQQPYQTPPGVGAPPSAASPGHPPTQPAPPPQGPGYGGPTQQIP